MKRLLIITGMHRSGTSALARICNILGAEIGDNLVPPRMDDNETGFWEHQGIVDINEEILKSFNSTHLDIIDLPDNWHKDERVGKYKAELKSILKKDFSDSDLAIIKDPRISRLLPLYHEILDELNVKPAFLISIRNPMEVALSLEKRNPAITFHQGLLLWLKYNIDAERHTRGSKRSFIYYPRLLEDWKSVMETATKRTKINWPVDTDTATFQIRSFLKEGLRHQNLSDNLTTDRAPELIIRAFEIFKTASSNGAIDAVVLDDIAKDLEIFCEPSQEVIDELLEIILQQEKAAKLLKLHIENIYSSTSWRITAPMRALKMMLKPR